MPETRPSDLVQVVTEHDEPIGVVPKAELGQRPGLHFRTAHAFLFDRHGHLLLQRLAPRRDRNPLRWGSSVAGYVHPGEEYLDTAVRRAQEELAITPSLDLVGRTAMPDLGGTKHIALYMAHVSRREIRLREREHIAELAWVPYALVTELVRVEADALTETFLWLFRHFYLDDELRRASA